MAVYPIKMMKDESGQPFVPLTSLDAVIGEKNLQYILDAEELSAGHFRVNFKDLEMKDITNSIIVVRWPQITSTVKPSYLKLNNNTEAILYDGTGKEYMDLEDASGTINLLAYDGIKWIQATGSGSGGGHVITDDEGHTMEQQKILNFVGFNVENDTANRATKIINPTPINNLTTTESGQGSLDAYQGNILSKRSVPAGGVKGQVLAKSGNGDHQLEWINQDSDDVITSDGSIEEIIGLTYEEYKALEAAGQLKPTTQYHITDMGNVTTGLTEASMVEFANGTNLEDRMSTKDIVDNGQNDRLDIAESNIDAMVSVVNNHSETLASLHAQDVSTAIVPHNTDVAGLGGHSRLIKYGPVYAYQVSFTTGTALAANTSHTLATISSTHRPNIPNQSIQGVIRANNDTFVSFWISGGQVQIYPTTTIPSGANLAGSFSWINL